MNIISFGMLINIIDNDLKGTSSMQPSLCMCLKQVNKKCRKLVELGRKPLAISTLIW